MAALAALLAAAFSLLALRGRRTAAVSVLLGASLGLCLGSAAAFQLRCSIDALADEAEYAWTFVAQGDASPSAYGYQVEALAQSQDGTAAYRVRVYLDGNDPLVRYGDCFKGQGKLSKLSDSQLSYAWSRGIAGTARPTRVEKLARADALWVLLAARNAAIDAFGQSAFVEGSLLQALICGYRANLEDTALYADFKACGLAHMVAVSGAHLSIIAAFAASVLRALRVPRWLFVVFQSLFLLAYLVFTGAPVSALRATLMALLALASFVARRRGATVNALALCVCLVLVFDPQAAVSVSFFLSAAATLGIVVLSPLFALWLERLPLPRFVVDSLALTSAACVCTAPYSAALFAQLPLISPIANLACAPLFSLACVAGLIAAVGACVFPAAYGALGPVAMMLAKSLSACVGLLAQVPFACVAVDLPELPCLVVSLALALALWVFWPRPDVRLLAGLAGTLLAFALGLVALAPLMHGDEIVMLNVGQGDAFLIRSGGACVLVDTGNQDRMLLRALARQGVTHLDAVVISHSDDDHCASLSALRGIVAVDRVIVARDAFACACDSCSELVGLARDVAGKEGLVGVRVGDGLSVGSFTFSILAPDHYVDEGGNADSLCFVVSREAEDQGSWRAFFCGDAEVEQIEALIDAGSLGEVDILKVGHHGSKASLDAELAATLSPRIALFSVGENNRYGHPSTQALEAVRAIGSQIYRSDVDGDVACRFDSGGISVRCFGIE